MQDPFKYVPSEFDIGKIRAALQDAHFLAVRLNRTTEVGNIEYALKLLNSWPRPGAEGGFSDREVAEMDRLRRHD